MQLKTEDIWLLLVLQRYVWSSIRKDIQASVEHGLEKGNTRHKNLLGNLWKCMDEKYRELDFCRCLIV